MKPERHVDKPKKFLISKRSITFSISVFFFFIPLLLLPEGVSWEAKSTIAIMVFAIFLFALEPIPLGMTSVLSMVLLLLLQSVPVDVVLSGFANPAVFLIIAGMMIAEGVRQTPLINRVTYALLSKVGHSAKGTFHGLFLLMQMQAFFIPATAVRVTLIMPIVLSVLSAVGAKKESNFSKLMLVGTAYAGNISGTAVLTAAVGNILTIEILQLYVGRTLSYFDWLLYSFPIWLLLMGTIPFIVWKCFPPEDYSFAPLKKQMKKEKENLGALTKAERKCIGILCLTVVLWMTQPLHGYHPTVPALLAVVLMGMPKVGFIDWKNLVKVNFDMVLLIGATLSLGFALIESGAIDLLEEVLSAEWLLAAFSEPWLALLLVVVLSQIYHLGVTNVSTAVVTLLPVFIGLSTQVGLDPVVISVAAGLTTLYGYILVVETMPNVVAHGTGLIEQKDFYIPGIWATIATTIITLLVVYTWWNWLGFWP
ncbi:DASS family sodium-coupled anion symporter [Salicibibacter cibarius]|uniref:Sodium-dependent dicarboxylate transporter SdcS n=1 Tax=Salicibibacter cibarius TaxID=2743000 RepID=A0A7T6Z5X1_9BACI|nr:DASS family sodium-coupled anion symporter [Salicibibacter cibarius]QQK77484.1 DASS family sodium-coupled anion symporter [Salicibibacter cibarius]